jgi:molybdopterin converting factor small subunit
MDINITFNLFAKPKEILGVSFINITVPKSSTIKYCIDVLGVQYPQIRETLDRSRIAKDCKYVKYDTTLEDHSALTLIPPISGG